MSNNYIFMCVHTRICTHKYICKKKSFFLKLLLLATNADEPMMIVMMDGQHPKKHTMRVFEHKTSKSVLLRLYWCSLGGLCGLYNGHRSLIRAYLWGKLLVSSFNFALFSNHIRTVCMGVGECV